MLLYKFLPSIWAIEAIHRRRLKISKIGDLNDPYELDVIASENPVVIDSLKGFKRKFGMMYGMACFSKFMKDPVIWAHYADCYRGLCLGFEVPDEKAVKVNYVLDKIPEQELWEGLASDDPTREKIANRVLTTKYQSWQYEDEFRVFPDLHEPDPVKLGMYFADFGPETLELREVIFGMDCDQTIKAVVVKLLADYSSGVRVIQTGLSPTRFEVIEIKEPA
jgi:hypothetical protein